MPKYVYQNAGTLETITRPVVKDIATQVLQMTGLPADLQIQYPGDVGEMQQPGSSITTSQTTTFDSKPQFQIVLEESAQRDRILSTAVHYPDAPLIFQDLDHDTFLKEVYVPTEFDLKITYRASDRDAALAWRNDIRMRMSANREVRVHQISYSYVFHDRIIETLQEIHTLQETVAPYGRDFETYLTQYFNTRARQLSTLAGTQQKWSVAETQGRVVGWFDFEGEPEDGAKVDGNAAWTISFSYKIRFDKPVATEIIYPLVIHNQMIDAQFRPTAAPARVEDTKTTYSLSAGALAHFEIDRFSKNNGLPGFSVPDFDEFYPKVGSIPLPTVRIATFLVQIDETNPTMLLDMKNDLGDFQLDPAVQDFMIGEGAALTVMGQSVLNVSVYQGTVLMNPAAYSIDNTLKITLRDTPDLRQTYHVRLAMHTHPSQLYQAARDRLRKNCRVAFKLLTGLCPGLITDHVLTVCNPDNSVPRGDFLNALDYIDRRLKYLEWQTDVNFLTVASFSITAQRGN